MPAAFRQLLCVWAAWMACQAAPGRAADLPAGQCALRVELTDATTGEVLGGIVQFRTAAGQLVKVAELLNRGQGVEDPGPVHDWSVLPGPRVVLLPAEPLTITALSGLETERVTRSLDLTGQREAAIRIALPCIGNSAGEGFLAGNTHLHLRQLDKAGADRYLREVPRADGLSIVFVSYLERAQADLEYTSNKYTPADLANLSGPPVRFGFGQEHRHNFGSYGEGYGHVLLLDIPRVIAPVSIGPGITQRGPDWPPLRQGILEARRLGGKAVWAHNRLGLEDAPNFILGRLDANNVCDGNRHGSYEDPYYQYLNIGLRVPLSSGADWFLYDFSRAYVLAAAQSSPSEWLAGLAAGRSYVSNGPLLEFSVDGQRLGATVELTGAGRVQVRARAVGRGDFHRAELVQNGRVVATAPSHAQGAHFLAEMELSLDIDASCWLALRTPQGNAGGRAGEMAPEKNELGGELFAHTSPIYVRIGRQEVFDPPSAARLLEQMQAAMQQIEKQATFADESQREDVLSTYRQACAVLANRLNGRAAR